MNLLGLFWMVGVLLATPSFANDLDNMPKTKDSIVKKLEKVGVPDARFFLSDNRIRLHPELFKKIAVKCPQCGTVCRYGREVAIPLKSEDEYDEIRKLFCPKCGWERVLPDEYGQIFRPESILRGKKFIANNEDLLTSVEAKYQVSKEIIAAVARVETNFGNFLSPTMSSTGQKLSVMNALLSHVVYDNRRKAMFERELAAWLKICMENGIDPYNVGSTCGAFGIVQFMPTSFQRWAIDWDGDGRLDLYALSDALASCANYLKANGWRQDHSPSWYRTIMTYNASRSYSNAVLGYAKGIKTWKVMKYERASGE